MLAICKETCTFDSEGLEIAYFSDDMSIKIGMEWHTQDWIWRKENEKFHSDCIDYRKGPSGTGIIFWGAFRWGKMGPDTNWRMGKT